MDAADRIYERLLVLRVQTGDGAAFEELVAEYDARLRYYLVKMLGQNGRAEDALQEVWLDVYRAVGRLTDAGAFRAWVYRIARDRAARELRKRRLECRSLSEPDLAKTPADDDEFSAEDARRVHLGLDQLGPEHREVLILRFVEDMNYEDIARVTGCPVGTVRSRIHYAKLALRRIIRSDDHGHR